MNTLTKEIAGVLAISLSTACLGMAGLPGDWRTRQTPVTTHLTAVASAPGHLVAVGQAATILTSADGNSWSTVPYAGRGDFLCATFAKGMYVAGGTFDCLLAISPDGVNWTNIQSTPGPHAFFGITYGAGRFVAVGRGGLQVPTRIFMSTNGIDWQPVSPRSTTNTLRAVTFGNGKYVAVGDRGTILTSADATTWTLQISGTEHLLRSVIFTGREFLAGGDSSTLLTSGDGLSWVTVPFSSFDVRGLATSGTAVVAVGGGGTEGRAQSSFDGLFWSGSAEALPSRLNSVVQFDLGRFIAVGNNGLVVDTAAWANTPINVWTNNAGGLWHDPYWSLGHIPSWRDRLIVFTNTGNQILEINNVTATEHPDSLKISELMISAPAGTTNALLLNHSHNVEFLIDRPLNIQSNIALACVNSAIEVRGLYLAGEAFFLDNSRALFRETLTVVSRLVQSNASISAGNAQVGLATPATWQQDGGLTEAVVASIGQFGNFVLRGGTHRVAQSLAIGGEYHLSGGTLVTSNLSVFGHLRLEGGNVSAGKVFLSSGTISLQGDYACGPLHLSLQSQIDFQEAGSTFRFDRSGASEWNAGGPLIITNWTADSDHLFFGHDQTGLTAAQLSRIRFVNPAGFSPGIYSARITPAGEVVPVPRLINYQRSANHLVLNWPEGYRLWTATNVAGPYSLITNAISPYTASYHTDPQRFFILRNEN